MLMNKLWQHHKKDMVMPLIVFSKMATHSSVLAWRIPGTEEPSGLSSMRLYRVVHDSSDLAAAAAAAAPISED